MPITQAFFNGESLRSYCQKHGISIAEAMQQREEQISDMTREQMRAEMQKNLEQQRHAGKPRARADIDAPGMFGQQSLCRERIVEMFHGDLGGIGDRGQVHARVPIDEHFIIGLKVLKLRVREFGTQAAQGFDHAGVPFSSFF